MGRSASACGFGWPYKCYKAKCIWTAGLQAAGLVITVELARQRTIDAAVGLEVDWIQSQMKPSVYIVYLIKICVLAYMLSQTLDGDGICEAVEKESEMSGEAQRKV